MYRIKTLTKIWALPVIAAFSFALVGCQNQQQLGSNADAASKVYVAPGEYDEFLRIYVRRIQWTAERIWNSLRPAYFHGTGIFAVAN